MRHYRRFPPAIPHLWVRIYSLLSLSPLSTFNFTRKIN